MPRNAAHRTSPAGYAYSVLRTRASMRIWRVSLTHFLQCRINYYDLYEYNYEFREFGLMSCFRTAAVEADPVWRSRWHAEAGVVLPLRFLGD